MLILNGLVKAANDINTQAAVGIDLPHNRIHDSLTYVLAYPVTIPVANDVEVRFATPDTTKWAHMIWSFTNDAAYSVTVFEGTTTTHEAGNVLTPMNANRNSAETSGLTICHTPGAGADGSIIWSFAGGANKTVTTATNREEFMLKRNTAYLVRLSGAQNDLAHILLDWYEHVSLRTI